MDYNDLYTKAWNDIEEDQVLPGGHWTMVNEGIVFLPPKGEGKSPTIGLFNTPEAPGGDVDKRALKDLGDYDFSENKVVDFLRYGTKADKRHVARVLGMYDAELPAQMFEAGEDGTPKISSEFRSALKGAKIRAQLKIGSHYQTNEPENQVVSYLPVE